MVKRKREKRLLMILGGEWHDFDGFARTMSSVLAAAGYRIDIADEFNLLLNLSVEGWDGVLAYTCFTGDQGQDTPRGLSHAQASALRHWVRAGGAFLGLHAATVIGSSGPDYRSLLGGEFQSHPPPFSFTVYPVAQSHPILAGISAFTIHDEFYLQTCDPDVHVHLIALYEGIAHPMLWSKTEGGGRVVYLAPGHFPMVWEMAIYQRLVLQSLAWMMDGGL